MDTFDAIIVGGGPAGLSAALLLGRCRRKVCLIDSGRPRNARARAVHGVFTRDGTRPMELRRMGRVELAPYDVTIQDDEVVSVARTEQGFVAETRRGKSIKGKKLLLATGVRDRIPDRPGFRQLFGAGVYVCPYCDGWENRDRRLAVYASAEEGPEHALALLTWSQDVMLVTTGEALSNEERERLARNGIGIHEHAIRSLEGAEGGLRALVLESGARIERDALFVHLGSDQTTPFAEQLGCELHTNGTVCVHEGERATRGVFVAGDASQDLQLVAIAIAEGVKAACQINIELRKESRR
jgi:thioredoxin reductase